MAQKINRKYYCNSTNWPLIIFSMLAIINSTGILVGVLYKSYFTLKDAILFSSIGLVIIMISYFRQIEYIEFNNGMLIIKMKYKTYKDYKYNFKLTEKTKVTRTLNKYNRLIIKNSKFKISFIIDSYEWKYYDEIKQYFTENNNE